MSQVLGGTRRSAVNQASDRLPQAFEPLVEGRLSRPPASTLFAQRLQSGGTGRGRPPVKWCEQVHLPRSIRPSASSSSSTGLPGTWPSGCAGRPGGARRGAR